MIFRFIPLLIIWIKITHATSSSHFLLSFFFLFSLLIEFSEEGWFEEPLLEKKDEEDYDRVEGLFEASNALHHIKDVLHSSDVLVTHSV